MDSKRSPSTEARRELLDHIRADPPANLRIKEFVGEGSLGIVVRAYDPNLRDVAVKFLSPLGQDDSVSLSRFRREAHVLRHLYDRSVVRMFDFQENYFQPFLKFEWLEGSSAYERRSEMGHHQVEQLATALLEGLSYVHSQGVVHRDISPKNILFRRAGADLQPVLIDFGLAKIAPTSPIPKNIDAVPQTLTQDSTVIGTEEFRSPEQTKSPRQADARSDLFSLAAVALWLSLGRVPWNDARDSIELEKPWLKHFSSGFQTFLDRSLQTNPDHRYHSANTALKDLREDRDESSTGRARPLVIDDTHCLPEDKFFASCFLCDKPIEDAPIQSKYRFCGESECLALGRQLSEKVEMLVSYLPDWGSKEETALPSLVPARGGELDTKPTGGSRHHRLPGNDIFMHFLEPALTAHSSEFDRRNLDSFLPYEVDHLKKIGLRCGNAHFMRAERIEDRMHFNSVCMLDFSPYRWSNTMKDPRSWAIINRALDLKINILALWTAGNAGVSLARIASAANRYLPRERQLLVATLGVEDENVKLELLRANALLIQSFRPLEIHTNREIEDLVADSLELKTSWRSDRYWNVTDGWEAVGLPMYRLIFLECFAHYHPHTVFLPAGTGNLAMGALLAAQDFESLFGNSIKLVLAVPQGNNVFQRITRLLQDEELKKTNAHPRQQESLSTRDLPVAPKIEGQYTPMLALLARAQKRALVDICPVSPESQENVARLLLKTRGNPPVRYPCEPSALVAFAALEQLRSQESLDYQRNLIVNTGNGILGKQEVAWTKSHFESQWFSGS